MPTTPKRFKLGKQSSLAPERWEEVLEKEDEEENWSAEHIHPGVRLMYLANEGDLDGIKELLGSGLSVDFHDIDDRTPMHIASCQGFADVVELLLQHGADVNPKDRWGSTPLADAIHYKKHDVIKLLEKHGAKPLMAPMHVKNVYEVPEYEIDPKELDFTNSVKIANGTYERASWQGTLVAVKKFGEEFFTNEDKMRAFRDELELLQRLRHPNVVQFLGAVTQSSPMMIVTEYLPKGDLCTFLRKKGALKPGNAVRFAMDIARGMNYLHENKPEAIIHRDLEPSNILRDDSGQLKVAHFGDSEVLKVAKKVKEDTPLSSHTVSWRYVAPEVFRNEGYDTKVDVFSFALILQEMIEGVPPFGTKQDVDVAKLYVEKERPPFKSPTKLYGHGLKDLIKECWNDKAANRPTFKQIITRLEHISSRFGGHRWRWKVKHLKCFYNVDASGSRSRTSRSSSFNSS